MNKTTQSVGFFKRIVVLIYDALLLVGVTLVGYMLIFSILSVLPNSFEQSIAGKALKLVYLIGVSFSFYAWFWTHGGQTLGMKVWNLYLIDAHGKFLSWPQAAFRYCLAILSWAGIAGILWAAGIDRWYLTIGLGFSWIIIDRNNLAWHDVLSGTKIVQIPKQQVKKENR